jgi:biotin transport system substrate-specific component
LSAWGIGFIVERAKGSRGWEIIAVIFGVISIYAVGVPWLKMVTRLSWIRSVMIGMVPFLIGDALKAAAALILARAVRPILDRQRQSLAL